jgi:hypothetical protein
MRRGREKRKRKEQEHLCDFIRVRLSRVIRKLDLSYISDLGNAIDHETD